MDLFRDNGMCAPWLFLIIVILNYGGPAFCRDVILYVYSSDPEQQIYPEDQHTVFENTFSMRRLLGQIDVNAEIIDVDVNRLEDARSSMNIAKGDVIRGVIFRGHGNSSRFFLSKMGKYDGTKMGMEVAELLNGLPVASQLIFEFASCRTAVRQNGNTPLHEAFLRSFIAEADSKLTYNQITVVGHRYISGRSGYVPLNRWQNYLRKTRIPHLIENIGMKLFIRDMYSANAYHKYLPLAVGATGLSSILLANGYQVDPSIVYVLVPGTFASMFTTLASPKITEKEVSMLTADAKGAITEHHTSLYNAWTLALDRPHLVDACPIVFRHLVGK